ncbi:hypothetical protein [Delftia tsuruhatensis]|uniref:hypothetical protein n=1 Tax=Delftia tsuruhatensis TaxID=180282 RepID=UPI001F3493FF|nr:hypothetical protein [Delftia tsuruhatensis]
MENAQGLMGRPEAEEAGGEGEEQRHGNGERQLATEIHRDMREPASMSLWDVETASWPQTAIVPAILGKTITKPHNLHTADSEGIEGCPGSDGLSTA